MKSYFISLFNYDHYANERILEAIIKCNRPENAVNLFSHLLTAQQVWLNRCLCLAPAAVELWPSLEGKTDTLADLIKNNHQTRINYLNSLKEPDFDKIINYKNTKGDSFDNPLNNILAHVVNHGTHHRAQIGQQLKFAGIENLPITDYIFYLRQLKY
jgi:uncharacterized damage-inducible protein DinB